MGHVSEEMVEAGAQALAKAWPGEFAKPRTDNEPNSSAENVSRRALTAALSRPDSAPSAPLAKMREALEFYANPETYECAEIDFPSDRSCGDFIGDFSHVDPRRYNHPMPGKRAREALASAPPAPSVAPTTAQIECVAKAIFFEGLAMRALVTDGDVSEQQDHEKLWANYSTKSVYRNFAKAALACSTPAPSVGVPEGWRNAMQEACDLLAERKYGSAARSPGHSARLVLEEALAASPTQEQVGRKLVIDREWCIEAAKREGDQEVGVGFHSLPEAAAALTQEQVGDLRGSSRAESSGSVPQRVPEDEHTPGPWRVGNNSRYAEVWGPMRMNGFPIIASMEHEPRAANARLMARAPAYELLWNSLSEDLRSFCLSEAPEWVRRSLSSRSTDTSEPSREAGE